MKKLLSFRLLRRQIAWNSAAMALPDVAVNASNERPIGEDEWEQITPWGEFPNPRGLQRISRVQGDAMVTAYNSLSARIGRFFRGLPVFNGHPDVDPENYPDQRRIGKVDGLESRDDGLYGKIAWNDLGRQNKEQGYLLYPSGVWRFKKAAGGVIEPFEMISVGMTNMPVIASVRPWAANAGTSDGAKKGWATRRAGGASGKKNPKAVKAKAVAKGKKMSVKIKDHVASLDKDSVAEMAAGKFDEVQTDALHAATGAGTPEDMESARSSATDEAKKILSRETKPAKSPGQGAGRNVKAKLLVGGHKPVEDEGPIQGTPPPLLRDEQPKGPARVYVDPMVKGKATPPPLPPRSTSSGEGNHVHIHFGGKGEREPVVGHGAYDPYFSSAYADNSLSAKSRRSMVARNARKTQTAGV